MDVPGFTRDERRNPHWKVPYLVPVERMDNSLAMSMHWGNISVNVGKGKKAKRVSLGDVSMAIGGFVCIVTIDGKEEQSTRRYAINLFDFIQDLINSGDPVMRAVPKLPAPPLRKTQPGSKKRAKRK